MQGILPPDVCVIDLAVDEGNNMREGVASIDYYHSGGSAHVFVGLKQVTVRYQGSSWMQGA